MKLRVLFLVAFFSMSAEGAILRNVTNNSTNVSLGIKDDLFSEDNGEKRTEVIEESVAPKDEERDDARLVTLNNGNGFNIGAFKRVKAMISAPLLRTCREYQVSIEETLNVYQAKLGVSERCGSDFFVTIQTIDLPKGNFFDFIDLLVDEEDNVTMNVESIPGQEVHLQSKEVATTKSE